MTATSEIITKLKEVRKEKNLSYSDILELMEKNGDYLSKSTISRVFQDNSESISFRYDDTIRPIAKALLDIERIEDADSLDVQAMKSLLQYKIQVIENLEQEIEQLKATFDKEKVRLHEKIEHERDQAKRSIDFLQDQVERKDKRIDVLLEALLSKDLRYDELWNLALSSPCWKSQGKGNKI